MIAVAIVVSAVSLSIAAIHVYWGHGGLWPGATKQDLIDKVYGTGSRFPGLVECYAVAAALLVAGALPLVLVGLVDLDALGRHATWMAWVAGGVLAARGVFGYLPALERKWTPVFVRLNRRVYGPLCIGLAAGFFSLAV